MVDELPVERALRNAKELASYGFTVMVEIPGDAELRKQALDKNRVEQGLPVEPDEYAGMPNPDDVRDRDYG